MNPLKGGPPRGGWRRKVLRAPIGLYRMGLGGLLGHRLVLLVHTGRKSGLPRQVVLEVVGRGDAPGSYVIASGYGERAQWYRNIVATPAVRYQVGARKYRGTAVPFSPEKSGRRLADYAARHPRMAAKLMASLGHAPRTPADFAAIGADPRDGIPLVLLAPVPDPRRQPAGDGSPVRVKRRPFA